MEEEEKKEETKELAEKINEKIEGILQQLSEEDILSNVDLIGKLVDIHKDFKNERYWKVKEEKYMRYNDGYGNYSEGGYGRRGVPGSGRGRGNYRGHNPMEEMMRNYEDYNEASEEMYRGNYGAEGGMVKSVEEIMKNIYEIVCELSEADSPEAMRVIKRYSKKISELE